MMGQTREDRLISAFSSLAAVLTDDYDVVGLLDRLVRECAELLGRPAGGLLLSDAAGGLHLAAATSENAAFVEMMQLESGTGPCVECVSTGEVISVGDIAATDERWAVFRQIALAQGFRAVHSTPVRLRGRAVGGMNLFDDTVGELNSADASVVQTLADVAAIGIMQKDRLDESNRVAEQLQHALDSRILIEQAKGVLAFAASLDVDDAFRLMREYARKHNLGLRSVADAIVRHRINLAEEPDPAVFGLGSVVSRR